MMTQPAGQGATVEYRFRNGDNVVFTAQEIKVEKLLDDVKAEIKSQRRRVGWQNFSIGDIGYRLVTEHQKQYLGRQVVQWELPLKPRAGHFDQRITVSTPLQKAGAYLLTAKMAGGNTSYIIVWLADTAIVHKQLQGKNYYYVADAAGGAPVPKAEVEFFGWRQEFRQPNQYEIVTKQFAEYADADGQLLMDPASQPPQDFQWLVIARTKEGRFAYLGFSYAWLGNVYDADYNQAKAFAITDRPVYRPEQTVKYKFWVEYVRYDQPDTSAFAGQSFTIEIHNPKGEKVVSVERQGRRLRRAGRRVQAAGRRDLGRLRHGCPAGQQAFRQRQLPRRGVQEARVRGERRGPERAGHAGREDRGHHRGQVLLRRAGDPRQGEVQDHADQPSGALVSAVALGLALRVRLLVVRLRLRLVSGLAPLGLRGRFPSGGRMPSSRPSWWPSASLKSAPTAR